MEKYLLLKQGTIHNAITEEPFVADILVENGKIKMIAPVLEGKVINEAEVIDATGLDIIRVLWRRTVIWGSTAMPSAMKGGITMS